MTADPLRAVSAAADKARDWTARRDRAIRAALDAGISARQVAKAAGLTGPGVAKIARRSNVPPPPPKTYLTRLPAEVPAGLVLVHNSVRPTRRLGSRGFRAWLTEPGDRLVRCDCGWASELGAHYRPMKGPR